MVLYDSTHSPTIAQRQRVRDLATAGIPIYMIAKIVQIDDETLTKHYRRDLDIAQAEAVERIGKMVAMQAENGDHKSQALYLKTQGAKFGWVEKQVVENVDSAESQALRDKVKELEGKFVKDY